MACVGCDWCFRVLLIRGILFVTFAVFLQNVHGEPVHLMSVTPTPYGAAQDGASFICLLSDPDTDKLGSITTRRLVRRGNNDFNTFELPGTTVYTRNATLNIYTADLPNSLEAQGVFYCEGLDGIGIPTTVPVTLLHYDRHFEPAHGQFTVTASIGDTVNLEVNMRGDIPNGLSESADILWQKQADLEDNNFNIYTKKSDTTFSFDSVTLADSGVYATYWRGMRGSEFKFSLIRLIVRECSAGRWGPSCTGICDNCYNGGICDDKTGKCVCKPGFTGPNCLTACGTDQFGWDCEHECGPGKAVSSCQGSVFCMPDPVGCSCMTGWMGVDCKEECPVGKFGAGCTELCHCLSASCDRFNGSCRDGACVTGWSGNNCQVPDACPSSYFGSNCTAHTPCFPGYWGPNCEMDCHCLKGTGCVWENGKCEADVTTGLGLCEPGYVSDSGINLDNCQQDVGCFDNCTETCHCKEGSHACDVTSGECSGAEMCTYGWTGPSCQTGIVSLTYEKTNPAQPVNVTCIVTSDPIPTPNQVHLFYVDESGASPFEVGTNAQTMEQEQFLIVVYEEISVKIGLEVKCSLTSGTRTVVVIRPEFYKLPTLSKAPSVIEVAPTSVILQWHAWNPYAGDVGDGPVIGYHMYYTDISNVFWINGGFVASTEQKEGLLSGTIDSLQPNTAYSVVVTAVRDGPGGEGAASPAVLVTRLPTPNETPTPKTSQFPTMMQSASSTMQPTTLTLTSTEQPSKTAGNTTQITTTTGNTTQITTTAGKTIQRTTALESTIQPSTLEGTTSSITTQSVSKPTSGTALMSTSQASSTQSELNMTSITTAASSATATMPTQSGTAEVSSPLSMDTDFTSPLVSTSGMEKPSQVPDTQLFKISMTLDAVNGVPAKFSEALRDSNSEEFRNLTSILLPLVENLIASTEKVSGVLVDIVITGYTEGSLIVMYDITVDGESSTLTQEEVAGDIEGAIARNSDPGLTVKSESLTVVGGTPLQTTDTSYISPLVSTFLTKPTSGSSVASIIAAVVVTIVCIPLVIIAVVIFLRWRRKLPKRYPPSLVASEADLDRLSTVMSPDTQSLATIDGYINSGYGESEEDPSTPPPPSANNSARVKRRLLPSLDGLSTDGLEKKKLHIRAVDVDEFASYVKEKRETSDLRVEWESLPSGVSRPTTVAKQPENIKKNRFKNVVAYDTSRVLLDPIENEPDSDYINACYIRGIQDHKAYIATQGPSETTTGDYWRMVWQENVSVMVMLCNLREEGRTKCHKYWPDLGSPVSYGGISVISDGEQKKEDYIIRRFTLKKEGSEDDARQVTQIHYTHWPDKGVPKHCTPVLKFIKEVNRLYDRGAPLLVHCSAGAGRTGTTIAIHAMMDLSKETQQIDIYNFVFSLRNSRPQMVQTAEQYIFVHDTVLEYLLCKDTFVKAGEFHDKLKSLNQENSETGNTYVEDEFEVLNLVSPSVLSGKIRGSLKQDSIARIRSDESLPVDTSRPYLMTPRDDGTDSNYINAAYVHGYRKNHMFLTTQMPMADTVVDLWRMVYDYNCTSIVQLNAMDPNDEDCAQFWPDEGSTEYDSFRVSLMKKQNTPDFDVRTLQLIYTKSNLKAPISVQHFQYMTWPMGDERPATSDGILQLISAVEKWQKTLEQPGPIVVMCMNAAGRTGVFCAIHISLDQVKEEQGADVLQNVKLLRIHRTNMVDTKEKYLFCYEVLHQYLKAFDDYSNNSLQTTASDSTKQTKHGDTNAVYSNITPNIAPVKDQKSINATQTPVRTTQVSNGRVKMAAERISSQKPSPLMNRKSAYAGVTIPASPSASPRMNRRSAHPGSHVQASPQRSRKSAPPTSSVTTAGTLTKNKKASDGKAVGTIPASPSASPRMNRSSAHPANSVQVSPQSSRKSAPQTSSVTTLGTLTKNKKASDPKDVALVTSSSRNRKSRFVAETNGSLRNSRSPKSEKQDSPYENVVIDTLV